MTTSTMFGEAKNKYLQNMISIRNPSAAKGSVRELQREFRGAKTHAKRLRIAGATMLAANRADASAKRKDISAREKAELGTVANIYRRASKGMFSILK